MISVVILTLNEENNLPRCLASVDWSDDVLVLDSGSTDGTVDVASAAGARVKTRAFDSFAGQRNYAMTDGGLRHSWVLHLDADEVVTRELRRELETLAATNDAPYAVYRVPSRTILMGRWLRHAGMYPSYQVRFGRADSLRFVDYGHGQREVQQADQVGTLHAALEHHNFSKGLEEWHARHRRYARAEAEQSRAERGAPLRLRELVHRDPTVRRRALKRLGYRLPWRPALRFLYVYVLRGGFLDGGAGLQYARMMAAYQRYIDAHAVDLDRMAASTP